MSTVTRPSSPGADGSMLVPFSNAIAFTQMSYFLPPTTKPEAGIKVEEEIYHQLIDSFNKEFDKAGLTTKIAFLNDTIKSNISLSPPKVISSSMQDSEAQKIAISTTYTACINSCVEQKLTEIQKPNLPWDKKVQVLQAMHRHIAFLAEAQWLTPEAKSDLHLNVTVLMQMIKIVRLIPQHSGLDTAVEQFGNQLLNAMTAAVFDENSSLNHPVNKDVNAVSQVFKADPDAMTWIKAAHDLVQGEFYSKCKPNCSLSNPTLNIDTGILLEKAHSGKGPCLFLRIVGALSNNQMLVNGFGAVAGGLSFVEGLHKVKHAVNVTDREKSKNTVLMELARMGRGLISVADNLANIYPMNPSLQPCLGLFFQSLKTNMLAMEDLSKQLASIDPGLVDLFDNFKKGLELLELSKSHFRQAEETSSKDIAARISDQNHHFNVTPKFQNDKLIPADDLNNLEMVYAVMPANISSIRTSEYNFETGMANFQKIRAQLKKPIDAIISLQSSSEYFGKLLSNLIDHYEVLQNLFKEAARKQAIMALQRGLKAAPVSDKIISNWKGGSFSQFLKWSLIDSEEYTKFKEEYNKQLEAYIGERGLPLDAHVVDILESPQQFAKSPNRHRIFTQLVISETTNDWEYSKELPLMLNEIEMKNDNDGDVTPYEAILCNRLGLGALTPSISLEKIKKPFTRGHTRQSETLMSFYFSIDIHFKMSGIKELSIGKVLCTGDAKALAEGTTANRVEKGTIAVRDAWKARTANQNETLSTKYNEKLPQIRSAIEAELLRLRKESVTELLDGSLRESLAKAMANVQEMHTSLMKAAELAGYSTNRDLASLWNSTQVKSHLQNYKANAVIGSPMLHQLLENEIQKSKKLSEAIKKASAFQPLLPHPIKDRLTYQLARLSLAVAESLSMQNMIPENEAKLKEADKPIDKAIVAVMPTTQAASTVSTASKPTPIVATLTANAANSAASTSVLATPAEPIIVRAEVTVLAPNKVTASAASTDEKK